MADIYQHINQWKQQRVKMALCLIVETKGSTPRKIGAKMLVREDGFIVGSIGGGGLEKKVIENAIQQMKLQKSTIFEHALVQDHGMCCGGSVRIFIEPIVLKKSLYIFGVGHIGKALASLAKTLDFELTLIDNRSDIFDNWSIEGFNVLQQNPLTAMEDLVFDKETFIAVMTHDHSLDREIIVACAKQNHAYLGMIGSQRKVEIAKKIFLTGNILTEKEMENIDWPMGIPIKVQSPEEIAVAILAKMIDVRSKL